MNSTIDASVIIVNWNAEQYLRRCLLAPPGALGTLENEIIVVDNASSDGSVGMMRAEFPTVKLVLNGVTWAAS